MAEPIHVVLGWTEEDYEAEMERGRHTVGWQGMPADQEPRWHSHPALGISGHSHGTVAVARTPHVHRAEVVWTEAVPIIPEEGEGRAGLRQSDPAPSGLGSADDPTQDGPESGEG